MKTIDFVVRENAGGLQRGTVAADAASHTIQAQSGQEISLNLRQTDLQGQMRDGNDLILTLADGRTITIQNYFNDSGDANRLFVSADGYLNEVSFVEMAGGALNAQYGPTEEWGKWSPSDDLIYLGRTEYADAVVAEPEDEVSMLGAALLGGGGLGGAGVAAGVVGGGAVLSSLGGGDSDEGGGVAGGDGGSGTQTDETGGTTDGGGETKSGGASAATAPYVNDADTSTDIGGNDTSTHTLTVTGGGKPGDTVDVTVGDKTQSGAIGDDGTFSVTFEGDSFPQDGNHDAQVIVTTDNGQVLLDGPGYVIDTIAPQVEVTEGTESTGDFFNGESFANGVVIKGTGEAGATVELTVQGITRTTTVNENGNWSVRWQPGTLESGEYTSAVNITTTDAFGNSRSSTETLVVDTVTEVSINTATVEIDGIVNGAEASDGVSIGGTAEPGATVVVEMNGFSHTVTTNASGRWSADFAAGELPAGEYLAAITATSTDNFGNVATATGQIEVDTLVRNLGYTSTTGGADGVINAAEAADDLVVTGTTEPGSTVSITLGGVTHQATVDASGNWTATFASAELAAGEYSTVMTATATDAAGNVATVDQTVTVDTVAGSLTIDPDPVEGDDVVNFAERADGVTITGTADPGAIVDVTLGGATATVQANAGGNWSATYPAGDIPKGDYTAQITATTTDAAGNTRVRTDSVEVDTRVDNLTIAADLIGGDGVINAVENAGVVTITGTTEVGSTSVVVSHGGGSVNASVDGSGNWVASFPANSFAGGTYDAAVTVTAVDAAGNSRSVSETVHIDTEVVPLTNTSAAGGADGVVNAAEAAVGVDLGGQVEAGSTVIVTFDGTDHTAIVDSAGNWAVNIPAGAIRSGTYDAAIKITATDAVGNVASLTDTLAIDTDAPDGPVVASYTRDGDGFRAISVDAEADTGVTTDVAQVNPDGSVQNVVNAQSYNAFRDETNIDFAADVPDGSDIVITNTDAAGNSAGTYLVLDDETIAADISVDSPALGNYQIETVDLQFAEEAHLTIDEDALVALSTNTNTLLVKGGGDDKITIAGGTKTGTTTVDGDSYDVYSVGEGTVIVDENINVI